MQPKVRRVPPARIFKEASLQLAALLLKRLAYASLVGLSSTCSVLSSGGLSNPFTIAPKTSCAQTADIALILQKLGSILSRQKTNRQLQNAKEKNRFLLIEEPMARGGILYQRFYKKRQLFCGFFVKEIIDTIIYSLHRQGSKIFLITEDLC